MSATPKVSVIIPVYNVEKYLKECLDSVVNQTLSDIEIICVNDGSTDSSLDILREYQKKDSRIQIVSKANSGYGHTMNCGLDTAKGKYVAFLESDDFIDERAYQDLYEIAEENNLDIIKAGYFEFHGVYPNYVITPKSIVSEDENLNRVLSPREEAWSFYVPMMNCLGLFRKEFLNSNFIRHNETPGASHQDMGFWFKTFSMSERVMFIEKKYYYYRQDNPNSSINNRDKLYCVRDEYESIYKFLEKHNNIKTKVIPIYYHRMYGSLWFYYTKLIDDLKPIYLFDVLRKELVKWQARSDCDFSRFSEEELSNIKNIIENPMVILSKNQDIIEKLNYEIKKKNSIIQELKLKKNTSIKNKHEDDKAFESSSVPKVSVIIPVYNTEQYLNDCLKSVCNQTLKKIEIICVNDGSTDSSLQILNFWRDRDDRIKLVSQENMGQSTARNKGLSIATGKYVYFMDSDDRIKKDALKILLEISEENDLDILYFDGKSFFLNKKIENEFTHMKDTYIRTKSYEDVLTGPELLNVFHNNNSYRVSPCLQFIRRTFLNDNNISFFDGIIYEDNIFTLKCITLAKRVSHRDVPLFERRVRENSTITSPKTFFHLYSYLTCYIQMKKIWMECGSTDDNLGKDILIEISAIKSIINNYYNNLNNDEKKLTSSLNVVEYQTLFDILNEYKLIYENKTEAVNVQNLSKELFDLRNSTSFKIGRKITWLPRKVRGGIWCVRDHGMIYTFKLLTKRVLEVQ